MIDETKGVQYIAIRDFSTPDRDYVVGDPIDTSTWPFRRAKLLEEQRRIARVVPPTRRYRALKEFVLDVGNDFHVCYSVGDVLDPKHEAVIPRAKLTQLVDRRWLAIDDTMPVATAAALPPSSTQQPMSQMAAVGSTADVKGAA